MHGRDVPYCREYPSSLMCKNRHLMVRALDPRMGARVMITISLPIAVISHFDQTMSILRPAITTYLTQPTLRHMLPLSGGKTNAKSTKDANTRRRIIYKSLFNTSTTVYSHQSSIMRVPKWIRIRD